MHVIVATMDDGQRVWAAYWAEFGWSKSIAHAHRFPTWRKAESVMLHEMDKTDELVKAYIVETSNARAN